MSLACAMLDVETSQRVLQAIGRVREGDTLNEACRKVGTAPATVRKYVAEDVNLEHMLEEAFDVGHDILADSLINIDAQVSDPKMAGVISKNIMWYLARKRPERYGDRMIIENVGGVDKEIVELMRAAMDRIPVAALPAPPPMIDVTPAPIHDASERARILDELFR